MVKVRFRCMEMVKIKFLDKNVVPGSTYIVDPGTTFLSKNVSNSAKSGRASYLIASELLNRWV